MANQEGRVVPTYVGKVELSKDEEKIVVDALKTQVELMTRSAEKQPDVVAQALKGGVVKVKALIDKLS